MLAVAAAASIWGTLGSFAKILYAEGVSFEALVAFRAFVGIGAYYLLYFYTLRESSVGTVAILLYSSPAFVTVLAWAFLQEGLGGARLISLLLTFGGIFLVVGGYNPSNLEVTPFVLLTGLLSGLAYGLYSIFGKPLSGHLPPVAILSYALGFGALLLLVAALPTLDTLLGLSPLSYGLLLMLAVVHTSLAFGLYTFGLRRLDAGQAATVATVEPVVASVTGVAPLGEDLSAPKVFGALLVPTGAALAQSGTGGKEPGPPPR